MGAAFKILTSCGIKGDITFNSGDSYFGKNLTKAVKMGTVREDRVTDMAMRIVAAWYKVCVYTMDTCSLRGN